MKIRYLRKRFRASTLNLIKFAEDIANEYLEQGLTLTLRQLYYQFVSRDFLGNTQQNYKRLVKTITDARNAGLFDWNVIEDRTRNLLSNPHWDSPQDILNEAARQFRYDLWANQKTRVEVWVEKEALIGVFLPTCQNLDVPVFACRGYPSVSETWAAGEKFRRYYGRSNQDTVILHFGDHDPSGIDMTRDLRDRLNMYAAGHVEVERIALNRSQIDLYEPPPNPAKQTDSRFTQYFIDHGANSWELDALEPKVLAKLIAKAVDQYLDKDQWYDSVKRQNEAREKLSEIAFNIEE